MNKLISIISRRTLLTLSKRYSCCGGNCRSCLRNDPKLKLQIQKNREERLRLRNEKIKQERINKIVDRQSIPHHPPISDFIDRNLYFIHK